MALKSLSTGEMVTVARGWTEPGPAHDAVQVRPALAAFLPKFSRVLVGIVAANRAADGAHAATLDALAAEATTVDAVHDAAVIATHRYLEALAEISGDGSLLELLAVLLPQGRAHARLSFRGEAGEAALLTERLAANPALKKRLKEIPVLKGNLWSTVEQWLTAAKRLGQIEAERAQLLHADSDQATRADGVKARNEWVRTVHALRAVAETEELGEATYTLIFGTLDATEAAATRRAKASRRETPATPETEDAPS